LGLLLVTENPLVLENISAQSLSMCNLSETDWMHSWIKENYQLLFGKLNIEIIGQEINVTGAGSEGYLDFLALDMATGDTVAIEAKRDDYKHRDLVGQAIEYAAGVARFNLEKLNEIYRAYMDSDDTNLEELFAQHPYNISSINSNQQIMLIVQRSTRNQGTILRLKSSCSFLREQGVDVNIMEISWYTKNLEPKMPVKGDIIEVNFVWEPDIPDKQTKQRRGSSSVPENEDEFLVDKTDRAIEIYRQIVNLVDSLRFKYRRKPAASHITFYGKTKAFMVVEFLDEQVKLRLRLPEDYSNELLEKLKSDYDKLTISDNFLFRITLNKIDNEEMLATIIFDSYDYNS